MARLLDGVRVDSRAMGKAQWLIMRDLLQQQEHWGEVVARVCGDAPCCNEAATAVFAWLRFHQRSAGRWGMVSDQTRSMADATRTRPWSAERVHVILVALRRSAGNACTGLFGSKCAFVQRHRFAAECTPEADLELEPVEPGVGGDVGRTDYSPFSVPWSGEWGEGEGVAVQQAAFTDHVSEEPRDLWEEIEGIHTRDWELRKEHQSTWFVTLLRRVGGRTIASLQWIREAMQEGKWGAIESMLSRPRVATLIASAGQQMALLQLSDRAGSTESAQPWTDPSSNHVWSGRLSGLHGAVLGGFAPYGHPRRIASVLTDVQMIQVYGQGCMACASDCVTRWCVAKGGLDELPRVRTADVGSGAGTFMSACRLAIGKKMKYVFHVEPLKLCRKAHAAAWRGEEGVSFLWGDDPAAIDAMVRLGPVHLWQYSFRCRPFSHANRLAWWSESRQESARRAIQELIATLEYVRRARPMFVIIENVASIVHLTGGDVWATILHVLRGAGDYVWHVQEFGADLMPEAVCDRDRLWMVGVWMEDE